MSGSLQLNNNERLLIALCRLHFTESQTYLVKRLSEKITDWDEFVNLANDQGVIALCWNNLNKTGIITNLPPVTRETMHTGYLKSVTRNIFLEKFLSELSFSLKEDFGRIVLLKGMALEKIVYGNSGLRQMTDIDLLAEEENAISIRKALMENGYESDPFISPVFEKRLFQEGKHLPEIRKNGVSVDLHYKLFREKDNSLTKELIKGSEKIQGYENLFLPGTRLLFLYLIRHLEKHEQENEFQIRLFTDLVVLLESYPQEILNEELFVLARKAGIEEFLIRTLLVIRTFWEVTFNAGIENLLSAAEAEEAERDFIRFLRNDKTGKELGKSYHPLKSLEYIPGILNKVLFVIAYLIPSVGYMKFKYKIRSVFAAVFYYPVRWVHVLLWLAGLRPRV